MSYATDGKCHNANAGSFNHECGAPATWLGKRIATGHVSGFCDRCKEYGDERHGRTWTRFASSSERAAVQAGWRIAGNVGCVQAYEHLDFPGGHVGTWESLCEEYEIPVTG